MSKSSDSRRRERRLKNLNSEIKKLGYYGGIPIKCAPGQKCDPVLNGEVGKLGLCSLRELNGLAERLGMQQAAVSLVERRQDLPLDTLSAIVRALGETL